MGEKAARAERDALPEPDLGALAKLADEALHDLTRRLEARVLSGAAALEEYGALARCHLELARRASGI